MKRIELRELRGRGRKPHLPPSAQTKAKPAPRKVRIPIADDHPVIRKTVRQILEAHPRLEVIGEAFDGRKAVEESEKLKPDVVILNISMPEMNGLDATREIKLNVPESAIVILSSHADVRLIEDSERIGARAYVAKTKAGRDLVKAVLAAISGGDFVVMD